MAAEGASELPPLVPPRRRGWPWALDMETHAPYAPPIAVKVMRVSAATLATRSIPMFETTAEGATEPSTSASVMTWDPAVWDAIQTSYAQGSEAPRPTDILPLREASWTDQLMLPSSFGTVGT